MRQDGWRHPIFFAMGAPQLLWLTLFFIIPLSAVFILSFSVKDGIIDHRLTWTAEHYLRAFDAVYLNIFGKSLLIAAAATLVCLLVGYPVALAIAFAPKRLKAPLLLAVTLPFWINLLVRTYALIAVFRTRGFVNFTLEWFWQLGADLLALIGVIIPAFTPLDLLYTNVAVTAGIVYVFIPFMILPIYAVLDKFDKSYLEAAMDLGASRLQAFANVLLPLTISGVISGVIIVFVPALGAFFIADMLGGTDSQLIGNVIERQFLGANNWPFGAALSFVLMYMTFIALALRGWFSGRRARGNRGGGNDDNEAEKSYV